MRRREIITLLGGSVAAWPLAARAQQPAIPVIGFLHGGSPDPFADRLAGFRKGLSEVGFVEGRNIAIEYRWANNDDARVPDLVTDLINRRVAVIATPGAIGPAFVAKSATATIPIVFSSGADPVAIGLVASLNQPGGNVTGINDMNAELGPKRLGLMHELLPSATRFAALIDPSRRELQSVAAELKAAAASIARPIEIFSPGNSREIDAAFSSLADQRVEALLVHTSPLFNNRRIQLLTLAAHHRLPTIYPWREAVNGGGLIYYGSSGTEEYRQVGIYVGRILKGEKPADLPVMRPTKFELVINLQTARTLGIDVPPTLLAIADEVIE